METEEACSDTNECSAVVYTFTLSLKYFYELMVTVLALSARHSHILCTYCKSDSEIDTRNGISSWKVLILL